FTFLLAKLFDIGAYNALPRIKPAESVGWNKNIDYIGGLFLGLTVGLLLFGITQGETTGFSSFSSLTRLIGSVLPLLGLI
ncbi:MFS transporter, partial [Enterococcus faecalis]